MRKPFYPPRCAGTQAPFTRKTARSSAPSPKTEHQAGGRPRSGKLVARLVAKVGDGALFDLLYADAGHDIAVSLDSIQGVPDSRTPAPSKRQVACHHLNYFSSAAGLAELANVDWQQGTRDE